MASLAREYDVNGNTIRRHLNNNSIKTRLHADKYTRKYDLNESFFETIDTEEKAYWLGFLMADGSVHAGQNQDGTGHWNVKISLATADKERIEKFKITIGADNPIVDGSYFDERTQKIYYRSSIVTHSKKMVLDLIDKGCVPNKEQILQWPSDNSVSENLKHHFLRAWDFVMVLKNG
jgi:hypothetical protein